MEKEISYYYDGDEFLSVLDKLYSQAVSVNSLELKDLSLLNKSNLNKLMEVLKKVLSNIKVEQRDIYHQPNENLTIFRDMEDVKEVFDSLFSNKDLMVFGHGGNALAIMESKEFRCRYANLDSHFVPLIHTNESLSQLFNWPHLGCKQIMILALNRREFNPIYKEREKISDYDTDIYSIPLEYFVGYFDAEKKCFIKNPMFKLRHDYDKSLSKYYIENHRYFSNQENIVKDFLDVLSTIRFLLIYSKILSLDLRGIKNLEKQILELVNKAYLYQDKLTPDYLETLKKADVLVGNNDDGFIHDWDSYDWEIDEKSK